MNKNYVKYFASLLLFGMNGIIAAQISLPSYYIVLLRALIGGALLTAVFFATRQKLTFYKNKRGALFLALSGAAMGASWMLLYEAYSQIGVSLATLIYYSGPVIVMALSPLLFKEKLTWRRALGFGVVIAGVVLVNGVAASGGAPGFGILCGVLSAVTYAVMVIANKKAVGIGGLENPMLQLIGGFITVAVYVGIRYGFAMDFRASDWIPSLLLGLVNTGVGCWFYFSSIGGLPVQTVAVCGYIEPLSAVIFSALLLGEAMSGLQWLGAALIIGGGAVSAINAKNRRVSAEVGTKL